MGLITSLLIIRVLIAAILVTKAFILFYGNSSYPLSKLYLSTLVYIGPLIPYNCNPYRYLGPLNSVYIRRVTNILKKGYSCFFKVANWTDFKKVRLYT